MEKETKEIIRLTSRQILHLVENGLERITAPFDFSDAYRRAYGHLEGNQAPHEIDWQDFKRKIHRLKRAGVIRKSCENKIYYLEITDQGKKRLEEMDFQNLAIERTKQWDKKWRVIVYDIPEKEHALRDVIRRKLYRLGFLQVQKSIFVYPFECTKEINLICRRYGERSHIKFMIADIIEGEESIAEIFIENGILKLEDLA